MEWIITRSFFEIKTSQKRFPTNNANMKCNVSNYLICIQTFSLMTYVILFYSQTEENYIQLILPRLIHYII